MQPVIFLLKFPELTDNLTIYLQDSEGSQAEDAFTLVSHRKEKSAHKKPAVGKKTDCSISGGRDTYDIFVSHLDKSTTTTQLSDYIVSQNVKVHAIDKVSRDVAFYSSFKVKVYREHHNLLCGEGAPDFWPEFVRCRPFIKPRNVLPLPQRS